MDITRHFIINKFMYMIPFSKAIVTFVLMFIQSTSEIIGYANIDHFVVPI